MTYALYIAGIIAWAKLLGLWACCCFAIRVKGISEMYDLNYNYGNKSKPPAIVGGGVA